jgi:serine/threonine-protein kinase RsbW
VSSREERIYTSDVRELRRMSAWWCEWAASIDLSTEVQHRGELCLNETVANIIRHGGCTRAITITLGEDGDAVRMTIADDGDPFDPVTYPSADPPRTLDEAGAGGLGLRILRASADVLAYRRVGSWNTLTLTFSNRSGHAVPFSAANRT